MACGAILRRKLIANNITISASARCIGLNLGRFQSTERAALTTLIHKNDKSTPCIFKNFNTRTQIGFIMAPPTTTSQHVRYACTNTYTPKQAPSWVVLRILQTISNTFLGIGRTVRVGLHMTSNDWTIKWYDCALVYYSIMIRLRLGTKLLLADASITKRLLAKIVQGKCLSRRERQLLARTTADIFWLVPGSMFVIVPSIQFLLPLFLRLYPNVLSSSLQDKITGQEKVKRKLRARTEYAKFLQETATEMAKVAQNSPRGHIKPMVEEFTSFWIDMKQCTPVSNEEIFRFAKLFRDEVTLDHVSRPVLADMCASMGITPFGKDEYLRFILWEKLKSIKNDDKLIQSKGVESLSESEVRKACTERGMHVAEEMQQQLRDWLDLSLNHAVPSSLLIISRVITGTKRLKPEEVMLATLSSLPYELIYIVGVASLHCNDPRLDKRIKIESLELQEKFIKEEEEKELSEMKQSNAIQDDLALKEMTVARAVDEQEQLCELISDATTVLASVLIVSTECDKLLRVINKEMNLYSSYEGRKGPEGEREAVKAYRAAQEENGKDAELDAGDKVSSALLNRANGMLQKLEKETDAVGAKISYRWRVLERYCDGKVSLDVVTAAAFLKDTLDKDGIEKLITNLSKYKEEIVKFGVGTEDMNQGQNQLVGSVPPLGY